MNDSVSAFIQQTLNMEPRLESVIGADGYTLLGVIFFTALGLTLFRASRKPAPTI